SEIISVPGTSSVINCSFVTYSNEAKSKFLNVPEEDIEDNGAVSEIVARKMAQGARLVTNSEIGVATTGIAGPDGGTDEKPVGLVYIAISTPRRVVCKKRKYKGSRNRVRKKATKEILELILEETENYERD
ncbi:MAG: CinA family protein, partial [Monoglobales bacterium]